MKYLPIVLLLGLGGCDPAPTEARALEWERSTRSPEDEPVAPVQSAASSALSAGVASAHAVGPARPSRCGAAGSRPCPMQAMMRGTAQAAVARDDFDAMATALSRIAKLEPSGYSGWSDIALRGVRAAQEHDKAGVRASCSACHSLFRESFRASDLRSMPLF